MEFWLDRKPMIQLTNHCCGFFTETTAGRFDGIFLNLQRTMGQIIQKMPFLWFFGPPCESFHHRGTIEVPKWHRFWIKLRIHLIMTYNFLHYWPFLFNWVGGKPPTLYSFCTKGHSDPVLPLYYRGSTAVYPHESCHFFYATCLRTHHSDETCLRRHHLFSLLNKK